MKKLILISIPLLLSLISCSDAENSSTVQGCAKSNFFDKFVKPNNIQLTILDNQTGLPMEGVITQLGQSGSCLVSDANGHVQYSNLSGTNYDVHVFGPVGYEWRSYYNVDTNLGFETYVDLYNPSSPDTGTGNVNNTSYVKLNGTVTNNGQFNEIHFVNETDKFRKSYSRESNTTPVLNYAIEYGFNEAIGTTIRNDFWALELQSIGTTGQYLVDAVHVPLLTLTSTDRGLNILANSTKQNILFNVNATKPKMSLLSQFNLVTFPTGLSFSGLGFYANYSPAFVTGNRYDSYPLYLNYSNALPSPLSFSAYIPPSLPLTGIYFYISATNNDSTWDMSRNITKGSINVDINSSLNAIPSLYRNQQGDVISWNNENAPSHIQTITIYSISRRGSPWIHEVHGDKNQISIPTLPNGVTAVFNSGDQYYIKIRGRFRYPDPLDTTKRIIESYTNSATWVR